MKRFEVKRLALVAAMAVSPLFLSSCTLFLSDYERPRMPVIAQYSHGAAAGEQISEKFWTMFKDPQLDAVIEKALSGNFDMRNSALKVEKARIAAGITATDRHPTLTASLGSEARTALDYHDSTHKSANSSFSIGYEADLFGRIEAANLSSEEEFKATVYDAQAMYLTVVENTAKAYWKYAYCKSALEIAQADLEDAKTRHELVQSKYAAGAVNIVDENSARISLLKAQTSCDEARSNLEQARTALTTLLGLGADQEVRVGSLEDGDAPFVDIDIPSALLERRPDLKAYEARVREALATTDEKKLSFFPKLTFTTGISMSNAASFFEFFTNPVAALGGAVTLPFLNFNKLSLERQSALKDYEMAQLEFVAAYISAVAEVYDALTLIELDQKTLISAKTQRDLAQDNYRRYFERYREGDSPLSDLLDAADTLRSARLSYIGAQQDLLSQDMTLMAALGGDCPLMDNQQQ